ncbi:uncharacterized protein LOC129774177 [Toxorhynchites rutilus septentrionalis]|uniref:uncharacterized protein LOC129774177 n=1 Tax=Toxorhynchites rutilus septentrionalis TaxID=329112 RepID=UPI002479CC14|nr:uncharacterized protein LOC129774177 [Toxorhynchites rutilus septentrionalis]
MSRPEKKLVECFMKRKALFVVRDSAEVFINNFDNQNDVFQIPIRVEALDRVYNEFLDLQTEIEKYDDPEKFEEHMQERATFEARYGSAKANHPPANFHLRLPKIDLPNCSRGAQKDFYVDDFLSGADTVESAIQIRQEMTAMLSAAGFPLKKWASNSPEVLVDIPEEDLAFVPYHDLQDDQSVSTLGLIWDPRIDMMSFKVQLPLPASVLTKRKIMSYVAQIFDPFGLVGPIIVIAKLFMQRLWALKTEAGDSYEWDCPLPPRLQSKWKEFHETLDTIASLRIPLCVTIANATSFQLHFFSDACCYVRSESAGIVRVQLLTSKSKVAPLAKQQTIARLELCGAVLASNLYKKVAHSIPKPAEFFCWTDS